MSSKFFSKTTASISRLKGWQRVSLIGLIFLIVLGAIGFYLSDRAAPKVQSLNWQNHQVGVQDSQLALTFNRPMDLASVEENLKIDPPLAGNISWEGRTMLYNLTEPPLYGTTYYIQLTGAREAKRGDIIPPYLAQFETRDRVFVYQGIEEEELGRLVLYNLTRQQKTILTPPNLAILDFQPYPEGDRLIFSAIPRDNSPQGASAQLYSVTTGLNFPNPTQAQAPGQIEPILDDSTYHNFKFSLSKNGETLVVQRANPQHPQDFGLWMIPSQGKPEPLGIQSGNFLLSPDGQTIAVTQQQGVANIPLTSQEGEATHLFPDYDNVLSFSRDGSAQVMVKYNEDETRSLFLITEEEEKELFTIKGSILNCQFEPRFHSTLYCLNTELVKEGDQILEEPYLAAVNIENAEMVQLLALPNYPNVEMSIAPDGIALLFDQVAVTSNDDNELTTKSGHSVTTGRLWLLPLPEIPTKEKPNRIPPEELISGFHPSWLP